MSKGKLFVISGTSGVGKSTVLAQLMQKRSDLIFSVSATTRDPRPGEEDGISYYFIGKNEFEDMIQKGEFLEYSAHMDNYYGTPKAQLEEKLARGVVLLDIEPNGAFRVQKARPDAVLVFIAPPSMEELERRLRSRGDTSEEQIEKRLARASWEMEQSAKYDYIVINGEVETCADEIINIIANTCGEE
jgi:guanylate kinase